MTSFEVTAKSTKLFVVRSPVIRIIKFKLILKKKNS